MGNIALLLNSMPHAFALLNRNTDILAINPRGIKEFACVWGCVLKKGLNVAQALGEKDRKALRSNIVKCIKGHKVQYEVKCKAANTAYRTFLMHFIPVVNEAGNTNSVSISLFETTQMRQQQQELEQLSWVASHTNNAVLITDAQQKVQWVNNSFERITGFTIADMLGKEPGKILQGAMTDRKAVARIAARLKARKSSTGEILVNYTKQGKPIWLSADITPIFRNCKVVNYVGIMTDITSVIQSEELRKSQAVLLQRQQLFTAIANYFPNGVIGVLNSDLTYVFVGGTELERMGLANRNLVGDKIFDKIRPDLNKIAEPYLMQAFSGQHVTFEIEIAQNTYQVIAVPIMDDGKQVSQILVVMLNITSSKKTEQELLLAFAKQKELNEMKSKFVSIASHEFRTPLSTILSSAYLAGKYIEPGDETRRTKHLNRIKQSVGNLTDILNDFLSLGRIEEGAVRNTPTVISLEPLLKEMIDEMQHYLKDSQHIELRCTKIKREIRLDKQHFRNVLLNLLSNAIKYSDTGKVITLQARLVKDWLELQVKDQGIGIPEEEQQNLFQTFFRANNVSNIQGTGMGLHIVKRYMDIMGGKITFTSKLNQGSVFIVRFPMH